MHRIMATASCPCRLSFRLLVPGEEGGRRGKMYIQKYGGCQLGSRSSSKRGPKVSVAAAQTLDQRLTAPHNKTWGVG